MHKQSFVRLIPKLFVDSLDIFVKKVPLGNPKIVSRKCNWHNPRPYISLVCISGVHLLVSTAPRRQDNGLQQGLPVLL